MVTYKIVYTRDALKDIPKLKAVRLDKKVKKLIDLLRENPYQSPPPMKNWWGIWQELILAGLIFNIV